MTRAQKSGAAQKLCDEHEAPAARAPSDAAPDNNDSPD
jgi:hypothetical protein